MQQLLYHNLLNKNDDYGVLSLSQGSYELLSGKRAFHGYLLEENILPAKNLDSRLPRLGGGLRGNDKVNGYDTNLFEKLRLKRKELADKNGVPPYIIFSDKSLIDMCQRKPRTKAEFSEIFGVGVQKLDKFSTVFLRVIND